MRWTTATILVALFAIPCGGCESCLDLDDYELVDYNPYPGTGGTTSTSSSSSSGTGGSAVPCPPDEPITGTIHVTVPVAPNGSGAGDDPCSAPLSTNGGLDVYAFDPETGSCEAHGRITREGGAILDSAARIHHDDGTTVVVAGTFRDGSLGLPDSCADGTTVGLAEDVSAVDTLFVAQLNRVGTGFCTEWARAAFTQASVTLQVNAVEPAGTGGVAIGGSLAGASVHFDDGGPGTEVAGEAFVAHYQADGDLDWIEAFVGTGDGAIMGLERYASSWLITGANRLEAPSCHGCSGSTHVTGALQNCPGAGGVGGAGGAGGAGGVGGAGGTGGSGGAVVGDALNALMWNRSGGGVDCVDLETYGSDSAGAADGQVGYGVGVLSGGNQCTTYWTGLAGRAAWRYDASVPNSALFDAGGVAADGFIMRLDGSDGFTCGVDAELAWSLRITPSDGSAVVWGNQVATNACADGATAVALIAGGAAGTVELNRCLVEGSCEAHPTDPELVDEAAQLMVAGLSPGGALNWHSMFGPVEAGSVDAGGAPIGRARDNLALDNRGNAYLAFETVGPLAMRNLSLGACADLQLGAAAGVYVSALAQGGEAGRASCIWSHRLGTAP